ncbi:MAG: SDR family NAD(P)-dependent oxidoreductase [Pseudomonadota bacterium]|nr:SDR family NAD(P)-dependent oxidoreductase [Pseudomonadota bacterium]
MTLRLEGRAAIVTGAASGIGQATADLFAREGAMVLAVDLPGKGLAEAHSHSAVFPHEEDVSAEGGPERIVAAAIARFGKLDILYNNAGVSGREFAEEMTDETWNRVVAVNMTAPFKVSRAAIPHLKKSPYGRIISTASVMARRTDFGLTAYCATKAGVAGMTRTLALELGKFGITCNYIEPGAIQTGMTRASFADEGIAQIWAKKSPLKRLGNPIDIARGALFLASDDGGFVTGHGLCVDGGLTLRT